MTDEADTRGPAPAENSKTFLEHLGDLRKMLLWSLAFLAIGAAIAIPLAPIIFEWLILPIRRAGVANPERFLRVFTLTGGFSLAMQVVFWTALLLSVPFIVGAIGWFVVPGLTERERKTVLRASGFAVFLFAAGVWTGYAFILPTAIRWLLGVNVWLGVNCEFLDTSDYIRFVLQLLICLGLAFELPVLIVILGRFGILTSNTLREYRRHAIVLLLIAAMVLTPGPDPVSMIIVSIPLVVLYEICIWIVRGMESGEGDGQESGG